MSNQFFPFPSEPRFFDEPSSIYDQSRATVTTGPRFPEPIDVQYLHQGNAGMNRATLPYSFPNSPPRFDNGQSDIVNLRSPPPRSYQTDPHFRSDPPGTYDPWPVPTRQVTYTEPHPVASQPFPSADPYPQSPDHYPRSSTPPIFFPHEPTPGSGGYNSALNEGGSYFLSSRSPYSPGTDESHDLANGMDGMNHRDTAVTERGHLKDALRKTGVPLVTRFKKAFSMGHNSNNHAGGTGVGMSIGNGNGSGSGSGIQPQPQPQPYQSTRP